MRPQGLGSASWGEETTPAREWAEARGEARGCAGAGFIPHNVSLTMLTRDLSPLTLAALPRGLGVVPASVFGVAGSVASLSAPGSGVACELRTALDCQIPVAASCSLTEEEVCSWVLSMHLAAHRLRVVEKGRRPHVGVMDREEWESEILRRFRPWPRAGNM